MTLRWVAEAGATLVVSLALGHALEALAYRQYFGLHWVPLGPGGGVDPVAAEKRPSPFGEHGWVPVPVGLAAMAWLWWDGAPSWRVPESFYGRCTGPIWGQVPTLVGCAFGTMPSILAAWLQWMPSACAPLPLTLSLVTLALSFASLLFWLDMLFVLPKAHASDASRISGARRSLLAILLVAYYLSCTSDKDCAAVSASFFAGPSRFLRMLTQEMEAQTPQGAMSASMLVYQVVVASLCVHTVIDYPRPTTASELWGQND